MLHDIQRVIEVIQRFESPRTLSIVNSDFSQDAALAYTSLQNLVRHFEEMESLGPHTELAKLLVPKAQGAMDNFEPLKYI